MTAHWHALAKLRLHTDLTLDILDQNTTLLGKFLREFLQKTSSAFDTKELPREADARKRKKAKTKTKQKTNTKTKTAKTNAKTAMTTGVEVSPETGTILLLCQYAQKT